MKKLSVTAACLVLAASLAACSGDSGTEAPEGTGTATAPTADASAPTTNTPADTGTQAGGEFDPSKGGQVTCGQWRAAEYEPRLEAVKVYLESQGKPSEPADLAGAAIDIDIYCVGTSHANDPIEPGFASE